MAQFSKGAAVERIRIRIAGGINTFFNGNRFFDPSVYRNSHLRDRPFVNTNWELIINQRDELVLSYQRTNLVAKRKEKE